MAVPLKYTLKRIIWTKTDDPLHPYAARVGRSELRVRINDFPDEPTVYSLVVDNLVIGDFNGWPVLWKRP
jgi:hypothetical protein